jgi:hypothetical protein
LTSKYRKLSDIYKTHLGGFKNEKLPDEAKSLFSVLMALQDIESPGKTKKAIVQIDRLLVKSVILDFPKNVEDIKIRIAIETTSGEYCEFNLEGQKAIRLMVLIRLTYFEKNPLNGYSDDDVKQIEGNLLKDFKLDVNRSRGADLRKGINLVARRAAGVNELVKNLAARNQASVWALSVNKEQISVPNQNDQDALKDISSFF